MSKSNYRISKKAIEDLEKIWFYSYKTWSVEQADRYYNLIIDEINFIADNFMAGRSVGHIRDGYRVTKVKSHLIFYKKSKSNVIEIIRILHQRMDIEKWLKD